MDYPDYQSQNVNIMRNWKVNTSPGSGKTNGSHSSGIKHVILDIRPNDNGHAESFSNIFFMHFLGKDSHFW